MYSCGAVNPNLFPAYYPAHDMFSRIFQFYESTNIPRLKKKSYRAKKGIFTSIFRALWKIKTVVFCYQNCSDLLWERKISDGEKLLKFEAEDWEFSKFLSSQEHFIVQWKVRIIFGNRILRRIQIGKNYWDLETYRKSRKILHNTHCAKVQKYNRAK